MDDIKTHCNLWQTLNIMMEFWISLLLDVQLTLLFVNFQHELCTSWHVSLFWERSINQTLLLIVRPTTMIRVKRMYLHSEGWEFLISCSKALLVQTLLSTCLFFFGANFLFYLIIVVSYKNKGTNAHVAQFWHERKWE